MYYYDKYGGSVDGRKIMVLASGNGDFDQLSHVSFIRRASFRAILSKIAMKFIRLTSFLV